MLTHDARTRHIIDTHEKYKRYVCRRLRNLTLAEDISQETTFRLLKQGDKLEGEADIARYGYTIANNLINDQHRHSQRTTAPDTVQARSEDPNPIQAALCRTAVSCLSERNQAIVRLHYWNGFTTAEIGRQLGISEGLVQVSLCRARKQMRERLAN